MTINSLYLYIPNLIPSVETQVMFNETIQNNYKMSFDEWYTERPVISHLIVQHDIGTGQQVNCPKNLTGAHQTQLRTIVPNKKINIAKLDNLDLRKYYVEIDRQRYPRVSVSINYTENDYIDQHRDSNLFFKEYFGEPLLNPLISYPDMKTKYSIGIKYLRHQLDQITPKKFQLFQGYGTDPDNARLFLILVKRREIEVISDGSKLIEG